ncbi:MAG: RapZ C-terminal domain-containing protein, partial [Kaistella sp.]
HLQINFGCTGGQHRSVYCAEKTAQFIREKYPQANVTIHHDEQPQLNPTS